jgi:phosphoserine phosphatase
LAFSAVSPAGLVVFDLDGTLLRGPTVCELFAAGLDRMREMAVFEGLSAEAEIAAARHQMVAWYDEVPRERLLGFLEEARWAPGAAQGVALLQQFGVEVAIASITWDFAVDWFARKLQVKHTLGTGLGPGANIQHAWPRHKRIWLKELGSRLSIPLNRTAAVGDSSGDIPMLEAAGDRYFVGSQRPPDLECIHVPGADLAQVAHMILTKWSMARL